MNEDTAVVAGRALTPEARANPGAAGTPVEIGGHVWLFAPFVQEFESIWDELFDQNVLKNAYGDHVDVRRAAVRLIWANYRLSPEEAADLVAAAPVEGLVLAVETALLGPPKSYRSYSDWVRSSLLANGLNPASVPPDARRHVLDQLVATGRAVPASRFISSLEARAKFADLRGVC